MWRLFGRRAKTASWRGRPRDQRAPLIEFARQEPPSFEGYSLEVLKSDEMVRRIKLNQLAPEELRRVLTANNSPIQALTPESRPPLGEP
jgi:hypothetical protein